MACSSELAARCLEAPEVEAQEQAVQGQAAREQAAQEQAAQDWEAQVHSALEEDLRDTFVSGTHLDLDNIHCDLSGCRTAHMSA